MQCKFEEIQNCITSVEINPGNITSACGCINKTTFNYLVWGNHNHHSETETEQMMLKQKDNGSLITSQARKVVFFETIVVSFISVRRENLCDGIAIKRRVLGVCGVTPGCSSSSLTIIVIWQRRSTVNTSMTYNILTAVKEWPSIGAFMSLW